MDFHNEWVSIGEHHRILLTVRDGYPTPKLRFYAEAVVHVIEYAEMLGNNGRSDLRLVSLFYDDTHNGYNIIIGCTIDNAAARYVESEVEKLLNILIPGAMINVDLHVAPEGNIHSDHYDHMAYLSRATGTFK